uniref:Uncharacterized protein n=1 Tax=Cacopsylla melanoneura TaxID=428564 RepID=A0A8D8TV94_9HEMI
MYKNNIEDGKKIEDCFNSKQTVTLLENMREMKVKGRKLMNVVRREGREQNEIKTECRIDKEKRRIKEKEEMINMVNGLEEKEKRLGRWKREMKKWLPENKKEERRDQEA